MIFRVASTQIFFYPVFRDKRSLLPKHLCALNFKIGVLENLRKKIRKAYSPCYNIKIFTNTKPHTHTPTYLRDSPKNYFLTHLITWVTLVWQNTNYNSTQVDQAQTILKDWFVLSLFYLGSFIDHFLQFHTEVYCNICEESNIRFLEGIGLGRPPYYS